MLWPEQIDYREGAPIPPGYRRETKIRRGLVIAGAVTFGSLYLFTIVYGSMLGASMVNEEEVAPLYVPIAGPFVTIGTAEPEAVGLVVLLVVDGLAQAGGLAMFIAGFAAQRDVLVRNDIAGVEIELVPKVGQGHAGLDLKASF